MLSSKTTKSRTDIPPVARETEGRRVGESKREKKRQRKRTCYRGHKSITIIEYLYRKWIMFAVLAFTAFVNTQLQSHMMIMIISILSINQSINQSVYYAQGSTYSKHRTNIKQEAQLPQRNSASAAHMNGGGGLGPPAHAYGRIRDPQQTYVKCAFRKAHFKLNRAFKVIQGHPYWYRRNPERCIVVMCN